MNLPRFFILNDDHSLREADAIEWSHWFGTYDCRVAWTGNEDKFVSTVFLGLDHRWFGDGPPLVFETMAFIKRGVYPPDDPLLGGRPRNEELDCERYGSWKAAEAGHKRMVKKWLIDAKTRIKIDEE